MLRVVTALTDCTIEGEEGKVVKSLAKGEQLKIESRQWPEVCQDVRRKIGAGVIFFQQVQEPVAAKAPAKAAPAPAPASKPAAKAPEAKEPAAPKGKPVVKTKG